MGEFKERLYKELRKESIRLAVGLVFVILVTIVLLITFPIIIHNLTESFREGLIRGGINVK